MSAPHLPRDAVASPVAGRMGLAASFNPVTVAGPRRLCTELPLTTGPYVDRSLFLVLAEIYISNDTSQFRGLTPPHYLTLPLGDLALELLDDLGHRLAHPGQLPVLDLDDAQA